MTPIVRHGHYATQLNISPIYENTEVRLVNHDKFVTLIQNHQLVALINAPIMKIVRAIRTIQPNAKLIYIS